MRTEFHTRPTVGRIAHRAGAIVLGVFLALGGLELGLRVAAFVLRPHPPIIDGTGARNEIRIVCIGESTTAGLWPGLLEKRLNQLQPARRFRVFNFGVVGIRTGEILTRLPKWFETGQFQLAITMLGINDEGNILVYPRSDMLPRVIEHSKALKLLVLLWRSARGNGAPSHTPQPAAPPAIDSQWDQATREAIERIVTARGEAINSFQLSALFHTQPELLEIDPATPVYHVGLMVDALTTLESPERLSEFSRSELGLDNPDMAAGDRYLAIRKWGRHHDAFDTLRLLTSQQRLVHDFAAEERSYIEALQNPAIAGKALVRFAAFLVTRQRPAEAQVMLGAARKKLPDTYAWSLTLAEICFRYGAFEDARQLYARALESRPDLPFRHRVAVTGWLARASEAAGHKDEARRQLQSLDQLRLGLFKEYTRYNYSQIVDFLRERDITVIAMQYPTLSIEELQRILDQREDVIYLENRDNFDVALRQVPYNEIFYDRFAGSFGHCTPTGEELITDNVANTIIELLESTAIEQAGLADQSDDP